VGPELLTNEGIVFVSPNYRLNILGFLNTGDKSSPGNFGLKDIILVLKWVRDNVAAFGGDPNNVTLMGFSGGSVGVHALVVSRAAAGLS
jgi:carboxylesterase type B